jgi:hypothetical protein
MPPKSKLYLATVLLLGAFAAGFFSGRRTTEPRTITITKKEIEWRDKIVYRDYPALSLPDCTKALQCYDSAKPSLDIARASGGSYVLTAGLCERTWRREIEIECQTDGNWKLYVGIGIGAVVVGGIGYGAYRLFR